MENSTSPGQTGIPSPMVFVASCIMPASLHLYELHGFPGTEGNGQGTVEHIHHFRAQGFLPPSGEVLPGHELLQAARRIFQYGLEALAGKEQRR